MNRLATGVMWVLGAALSATAIFLTLGIYSRLDRHMWMIFALGIAVGLVMRCWPNVRSGVQWSTVVFIMAAYVATIGGAWVLGLDKTSLSPTIKSLSRHGQEVAMVIAACMAIVLAILAVIDRKRSPWASWWWFAMLLCGAAVAVFSGSRGAPGGTASWLASLLHFDVGTADGIVLLARKAIHFTFYGCFAWLALRAAEAAGASARVAVASAFAIALTHACVDEWRQLSSPGRSGSVWDVLLDCAGMAVFVLVVARPVREVRRPAA